MIATSPAWQDLLGAGAEHVVADGLTALVRLFAATALGTVVSFLFRWSRRESDRQPGFEQTLVLLAPLIAMVTMAVGSNIAAAFTLVGTLAIVRFRTAIRDSRDTAFVIFSVAAGLAMGSGSFVVALLGTVVVGAAVLAMRGSSRRIQPAAKAAALRLVLVPPDADLGAALRAVESFAANVSIVRANADRKAGSLDVKLRLCGIEPARFPALLGQVLLLPEVVKASCEAVDETEDGLIDESAENGPRRGREPFPSPDVRTVP